MDDIPPYLATGPNWSPSCPKGGNKRRRRAAVAEIEPLNFIIGTEDCSNNQEYCNGPLKAGRAYKVKSFACTTSGCTETLYSQPSRTAPDPTAGIIGGAVAAVVAIVIAGVVIIFMKRKKRLCFAGKEVENGTRKGVVDMQNIDTDTDHIFKPCPVKLSEFPAYVENMHKDSNLLFAEAYKLLKEQSPSHPVTAANSENSRPKNRYTNIMPCECSLTLITVLCLKT
ncbi:tyrosine-protein phosphatase 10D-like [Dreissena polymorpha]|uniref:tyrosine-protein phosphatase 10D-like n=1 Tax=Dreissena polymorpha TaxID=45954 RepID=UPI00226522B3|nr:tyrosine-protein phosphatase 10D-like [Dreissena polymorpha]